MMELKLLADNEKAISILAHWYFDEWGRFEEGNTLDKIEIELRDFLNVDKVPLAVLAVDGDEVLGVAQLKYREMDIYPEKEHWLGGVYVPQKHRGNSIAEKMIDKVVAVAINLKIHKIFLQTENLSGGLYSKLGWQPLEQINHRGKEILIMERQVNRP